MRFGLQIRTLHPRKIRSETFQEQTKLACVLQLHLFVHEHEAHDDFVWILDQVQKDDSSPLLPPVIVHCFTWM